MTARLGFLIEDSKNVICGTCRDICNVLRFSDAEI